MLFIWLLIAQLPASGDLPKFEQFKVAEVFKSTPANPLLRTQGQRMFRAMIRDAAKKGANFAGHYAIAEWGCGAGCASMAVIDLQSGSVYDGPFGNLPKATVDFSSIPDADSTGFHYRADSRLLITHGCPNEKNCGSYFYEWTGAAFKLLRFVKEPKQ